MGFIYIFVPGFLNPISDEALCCACPCLRRAMLRLAPSSPPIGCCTFCRTILFLVFAWRSQAAPRRVSSSEGFCRAPFGSASLPSRLNFSHPFSADIINQVSHPHSLCSSRALLQVMQAVCATRVKVQCFDGVRPLSRRSTSPIYVPESAAHLLFGSVA